MQSSLSRRDLLKSATVAAAGVVTGGFGLSSWALAKEKAADEPLFRISLAEWSLHNTINSGKMTNLDFPKVAKEDFGIDGIEYVNQFFKDKAKDTKYLTELKKRCDDLGVQSLLIMCDGEGELGAAKEADRQKAVENHH
jgi:L-ribulose-5-phosphate 3-epimerase